MTEPPTDAASFRAWRADMGWTQARAASELGLSRRVILYYERGHAAHPITCILGLACLALSLAHMMED